MESFEHINLSFEYWTSPTITFSVVAIVSLTSFSFKMSFDLNTDKSSRFENILQNRCS